VVSGFVQAPLSAGLGAFLYRGLRSSDRQEAQVDLAPAA
jgi:hypothetical protein